MDKVVDEGIRKILLDYQKNEISEYQVYKNLSKSSKGENKEILDKISQDELMHYKKWKKYTNMEVKPDGLKVLKYLLYSKFFGLTFAVKLMERGEAAAQKAYRTIEEAIPEGRDVIADEGAHEKELIGIINEERLNYMGSMVLGLNDALVELTGTLSGLILAIQNSLIIGVVGLITGIAASLSMMSSEYLSQKSEEGGKSPLKASVYTGIAYIFAVAVLDAPFFLSSNALLDISMTVLCAVIITFIFTYFISVTKDLSFRKRFAEMASISLGVAAVSFLIGFAIRIFLNVSI